MLKSRIVEKTVVIVTGATSGIGREAACKFAEAGAELVLAGRRTERLNDLVDEIVDGGNRAIAVTADVGVPEDVERMIDQAMEYFGRVDTLVNNAGVCIGARFEQHSMQDFRRVMDVNFWGAVVACRKVVPIMKKQANGGVIINISALSGKHPMPFSTAYSSSKAALNGFSQSLRAEVMSEKIDVCTIIPGATDTEIFAAFANQSGFEPPIIAKRTASAVADVIVNTARFPKPEIIVGMDAVLTNVVSTLAPGLIDFAIGKNLPFLEKYLHPAKEQKNTTGNLYTPYDEND